MEKVDPAEASVRVNTLQNQIETALALTSRLQKISLINYLCANRQPCRAVAFSFSVLLRRVVQMTFGSLREPSSTTAVTRRGGASGGALSIEYRPAGAASKQGVFSIEDQVQSLLYVRRLWTIFIEDLAHPENGLPEKLRADIISIGLWVVKESDRLREEKSNDVMQLVEINRLIRDAL